MERFALVAVVVLALTGCASSPPPVSDKVQAYYESSRAQPSPTATRSKPLIVMIGDSFTAGNDETPGATKYGFADRAADALGWDKYNLAQGGTGYINPGANQSTPYSGVVDRAANLAPDIVLVGGGINDVKSPAADVGAAADALYKEIKAKIPAAKIVVMGPITPGGAGGEYKSAVPIRDVLKSTSADDGIPFIDPIAEGWMPTKEGLVGPTNFHPNAAGHEMLAGKLVADLQALKLS